MGLAQAAAQVVLVDDVEVDADAGTTDAEAADMAGTARTEDVGKL